MALRRIKLIIEYNGQPFSGWQVQQEQKTVQGEILKAIFRTTDQKVSLVGAGRTDAGVHALGQVASFEIDHHLDAERFAAALNYYLPDDIRVKSSEEVDIDFHARFNAKWRRYRYLVSRDRSALYRHLRWEGIPEVDADRLWRAAKLLLGEHDFSAFCVTASLQDDNHCRIDHARWRQVGPLLVFEIRGNRFLHSMVRSLVGGMVNLATICSDNHPRNLTLESFQDMLTAPDERRNVHTAPPEGLYLVAVGY